MKKKNLFLAKKAEDSTLNQYWFSEQTIEFLVDHIESIYQNGQKIAFLSTPSIYCSLKNQEVKQNSALFEFDLKLNKEKGFVFYDFNKPIEGLEQFKNTFDIILIDPPFITEEVWGKYAQTINYIKKEDAKILCCSIKENAKMLYELIKVVPQQYKPSIPHLIYQYDFYCNYEHEILKKVNDEIGF
ncbi:unnamed protein product (macronuclear) [Paramecium tetraurelia]|uniref:N6-adenine methyltransferase n=1 Tax=Paramecium tetraurelia TaxID=5888 RepID=A0DGD5_PARTE|nr:uncharacterized protein GSPATT00002231001 [Paramecium tetraurelia]CAK82102.1 unnamed protein product [Paramecium tetraurelia]|eukprot:XP_001449499.1 hypothetical protein (macronuclear) [Paramecium tetraurelia strain d4-2]